MNNTTLKTIGKYALILSILYAFEILMRPLINHYADGITSDNILKSIVLFISVGITFLFNILVAFVIYKDMKRLEVDAKYSVLLTIFFRPIGVVIFLVYLINKELNKNPVTEKM